MKLIDKDALVAEINKRIMDAPINNIGHQRVWAYNDVKDILDTLEVKEVGISIPNIDDTLKEEGLDPDSKEAKVFKESYYMALEKLKAQKGELV